MPCNCKRIGSVLLFLALFGFLGALEVVLQLAPQLPRLGLGSLGMFYLNVKWCNENKEKVGLGTHLL